MTASLLYLPISEIVMWFGAALVVVIGLAMLFGKLGRRGVGAWVFALLIFGLGVLLVVGKRTYNRMCIEHGCVPALTEGDYFVLQTVTTTGYGSGLAALDPDSKSSGVTDLRGLRSEFQGISSWLMIVGVAYWAMFIDRIIGFTFKRRTASAQ